MLIKAVVDPIESKEASNTVTLIPSKPSLASSVFAVTSKVVDVEPADNVTVPDNATNTATGTNQFNFTYDITRPVLTSITASGVASS